MKHVLAYQKQGSDKLEHIDIPEGYEKFMDDRLSKGDVFKFKNNIVLNRDEISGIFSLEEYDQFKKLMFNPKPTQQQLEWLEMGKALRERKPLDKWKVQRGNS